jgi:hypothetical protein
MACPHRRTHSHAHNSRAWDREGSSTGLAATTQTQCQRIVGRPSPLRHGQPRDSAFAHPIMLLQCTRMHIGPHTEPHAHAHKCTHMLTHAHTCTQGHSCTHAHTCTHMHTHAHMQHATCNMMHTKCTHVPHAHTELPGIEWGGYLHVPQALGAVVAARAGVRCIHLCMSHCGVEVRVPTKVTEPTSHTRRSQPTRKSSTHVPSRWTAPPPHTSHTQPHMQQHGTHPITCCTPLH